MKAARMLAWSWLRVQPRRAILTVSTMAIAISLVVFTYAAAGAAAQASQSLAKKLLGPYDIVIRPRIALQPQLSDDFYQQLAQDPRTAAIQATAVVWADIEDTQNTTYYESWRTAMLGSDRSDPVGPLRAGRWYALDASRDSIEGVIDGGLASTWEVDVGDELPLHGPGGSFTLRVVGIGEAEVSSSRVAGVWLSHACAARIAGGPPSGLRWYIDVQDSVDIADTAAAWQELASQARPPAVVESISSVSDELGSAGLAKRLKRFGIAGAALAVAIAVFMVHSAVASGAARRRRELALLRSIGASRGHIAGAVLAESLLIAALAAPAGILLAWLWLIILGLANTDYFGGLPGLSLESIIVGIAVAGLTSLIAAIGPARRAAADDPSAALSAAEDPPQRHLPALRSVAAVLLFVVAALLTPLGSGLDAANLAALLAVQIVLLALAGWWGTALAVVAAESLLRRPVAAVMRVPEPLLRQQGSARPERSLGIVRTLALCLGLSVLMNVWGRSMVAPFLPSSDLPAGVASLMPAGIPMDAADELNNLQGVKPKGILPVAVEQTYLAPPLMARLGGSIDEATVLILGLDPTTLVGDDPLLPLVFSEGDAAAASQALAQPGTVLVPADLQQRLGLEIGDPLRLMALGNAQAEEQLTVAGSASLPGWHWVTKFANMRQLGHKPLAPIMVSLDTARSMGIQRLRHVFLDLEDDADRQQLRRQLTTLAENHLGAYQQGHFGPATTEAVTVKLTDTRHVAQLMQTRSDGVIWVLGAMPLAALLIAMLGIAAAVGSNVQGRSREFGILRSVGLEGRACGRLVLAELVLLALASAILCIGIAIISAHAAIGVGLAAWGAGGDRPPLVIPILDLVLASLITALAAAAAAWGSAHSLARRSASDLLNTP